MTPPLLLRLAESERVSSRHPLFCGRGWLGGRPLSRATDLARLSPTFQSLRRFPHIGFRSAIAEPYEPSTTRSVEIHAGTDRYTGLVQHPGTERRAVIRPVTDIGQM